MNQSVCSDNGSDSKKDNDYDISERTESVLEKNSEKGVGSWQLDTVLGLKPILLWKEETNLYYYGKKKLTWPDGSKTVSKVHGLAFMVHCKTLDVPTVDSWEKWILASSHPCLTI